MTRTLSPYQLNPFLLELNPLRRVLEQVFDPAVLCRQDCDPRLFVAATNVRSGKPRVFSRQEVSVDALLASACLLLSRFLLGSPLGWGCLALGATFMLAGLWWIEAIARDVDGPAGVG